MLCIKLRGSIDLYTRYRTTLVSKNSKYFSFNFYFNFFNFKSHEEGSVLSSLISSRVFVFV